LEVGVVQVLRVDPAGEGDDDRELSKDYDPASARNTPPLQ